MVGKKVVGKRGYTRGDQHDDDDDDHGDDPDDDDPDDPDDLHLWRPVHFQGFRSWTRRLTATPDDGGFQTPTN